MYFERHLSSTGETRSHTRRRRMKRSLSPFDAVMARLVVSRRPGVEGSELSAAAGIGDAPVRLRVLRFRRT